MFYCLEQLFKDNETSKFAFSKRFLLVWIQLVDGTLYAKGAFD